MTSTFHGLETAMRALSSQQAALYTTGHNIANANTPGYTRQRVNFTQTEPYPTPAFNTPNIPGQIGTGVQVGDIQRMRDGFLDMQFRGESAKNGYWEARSQVLSQMEDVMSEPSEEGLANMMDQFWNALQDLAVQPQDVGARKVVKEQGVALADTFNYMYDSLKSIQKDYRNEIGVTESAINSILRQINQVNKEIGAVEPHGYLPNDLYDERDRLVDELSSLVDIKTVSVASGGNAAGGAEGLYDVFLVDRTGKILTDDNGRQIKLIDARSLTATGVSVQYENRADEDSPVQQIKFFQLDEKSSRFEGIVDPDSATGTFELNSFNSFDSNGKLKAFIEGYGYIDDPTPTNRKSGDEQVKGLYPEMMADLDEMAFSFANHFNLIHQSGWSINDIENGNQSKKNFFDYAGSVMPTKDNPKGAAANIKVSAAIIEDTDNIAAAAEGNVLAGAMVRDNVEVGTVGNPGVTGVYDRLASSGANSTGQTDLPANAEKIQIDASYDESTNQWIYTVIPLDNKGKEIDMDPNTPAIDGFPLVTSSSNEVELYGVKIDVSNVTIADDNTGIQTWTFTFAAEGNQAVDDAFVGNGSNALALADAKDDVINYDGILTTVHSFYQGIIGDMGVNASESNRMLDVTQSLKDSVDNRRMSTSSVSLDEEMTNMIKFQHAYNAAARNITAVDEMLDTIINGMGRVGR
ncbi:flagellar hook-associated protein FlgK [Bacillus solimangrovi]|uniref:Flagellar hook-associated protein 1 n=1 Tax=Bacillus solimangrovi TaxID=1305675 RepID=A0A1E5LDU3_9BACI|nr:flagellar hook-associated protein FlgK [Bacillus solimangrovi]OEH92199.1 flagellar hook-associated protein FlgK [Bacillus solimangrovi]